MILTNFKLSNVLAAFIVIILTLSSSSAFTDSRQPFIITVADSITGSGVALVELKTVNNVIFLTDKNGRAVIYDPGLIEAGDVYFRIKSPHGYKEWPKDGFGYAGKTFQLKQGAQEQISLVPEEKSQEQRQQEISKYQQFRLKNPYDVKAGSFEPFEIVVRDEETQRPVPLVELRTEDDLLYITDSAGRIAFFEPNLRGKDVTLSMFSYGYEGHFLKLKPVPGGIVTSFIRRINVAERLYRITGEGIYNDSILLGQKAPLANPVLCGKVLGQDTVAMTEYKGKLFWLWGDTHRPSYPLGNFKTSSARSLMPKEGGLEPDIGVNLEYFVNADGFSKEMFPHGDTGLIWMFSLTTVDDGKTERLIARYAKLNNEVKMVEQGMAVFNDESEKFETLVVFGQNHNIANMGPAHKRDGFIYVNCPYPVMRFEATLSAASDPNGYESFTCLMPGAGFDGENTKLQRDKHGKLVWAWKKNTLALQDEQWKTLVKSGLVRQQDAFNLLTDVETGKQVLLHYGSAAYNEYKGCWVMVFNEVFGKTLLGEVWIAAAKKPEGPWTKAKKIVTHYCPDKNYSFYNVVHHPLFDRDGGRTIYFEGTYTDTYSGNNNPTPRYNYNQIMYRLDLSDERLAAIW